MAIIKMAPAAQTVAAIVRYVTRVDKTDSLLMDGLSVTPVPDLAVQEMMAYKDYYGSTSGKQYHHVVISYHRDEHITPEQAARNALELAKATPKWQQHQILLATHTDRDHIHTHLIINSTNMATGRKLRWLRRDLAELKDRCVAMCLQQGLHVPLKGLTFEGAERTSIVANNPRTYNQLRKDAGYVHDIMEAIKDVRNTAANREDYIAQLADKGIGVTWTDTRKHITYIDLARQAAGIKMCKVKDDKLGRYYNIDVSKDALEADFAHNRPQLTVGQAVTMLSALQHQLEDRQTDNRRYIMFYNSIFGNRDKTINLMKDYASGCLYKRKSRLVQQIETLKAQQKELFAKHHMTDKLADTLRTLEKEEARKTEKLKEVQRQIDNYKELGPRNKRRLQYAIDRANRTQPVMYSKAVASEGANKTIKAQLESLKELLGAFVSAPKEQVLTMGLAEMIDDAVKNPSSNTLSGAKIMAAREIKPVPARQQPQPAQKAQKSKSRSRGDDWSR
jgi:hypothetical protein